MLKNSCDIQDHEANNQEKHTTSKDTKQEKRILKFLDLSKASLGFELSFSLSRIFAFLCVLLGFVLLVFFHVFYPLLYLLGTFIGLCLVILYLVIFS